MMMNINEDSCISVQNAFFKSVPPILYKYRDWNNCYHKRTVEQNKVWFSSPNGLNDPYDCQLPLVVDEEEIKSDSFCQFLLSSTESLEVAQTKWAEILENPQKYFTQREHELLDMYLDFGVLSLCERPDNYLLWSHYANGHKGFCIGFDTQQLVKEDTKGTFEDVKYQLEFPTFKFLEDPSCSFSKALATKHSDWNYEKEWRITKSFFADREVNINDTTIKEIYFGAKMDKGSKEEIIEILKYKNPLIKFNKMTTSRSVFKVEPIRI
jgi:hypothetical protein